MNFFSFIRVHFFCLLFSLLFSACHFSEQDSEICFVGDSITYMWDLSYYFPEYAISKHAVVAYTLQDISKLNTKDCANRQTVILIGTNNIPAALSDSDTLSDTFIESFNADYSELLYSFQAKKVYVVSVLPRNDSWVKKHNEFYTGLSVNKEIKKLNQSIVKMLERSSLNYEYINVYPSFLDKDGNIFEDYYSDNLHLSEEGYELLSFKIREYLE